LIIHGFGVLKIWSLQHLNFEVVTPQEKPDERFITPKRKYEICDGYILIFLMDKAGREKTC